MRKLNINFFLKSNRRYQMNQKTKFINIINVDYKFKNLFKNYKFSNKYIEKCFDESY